VGAGTALVTEVTQAAAEFGEGQRGAVLMSAPLMQSQRVAAS
jgi:hypothetical protein